MGHPPLALHATCSFIIDADAPTGAWGVNYSPRLVVVAALADACAIVDVDQRAAFSEAESVVTMVNGERYAVTETVEEIANLTDARCLT